jgi:predicted ATPase
MANENIRIDSLLIKNFGPIGEAEIDFRKLTVFIGPNNAGKSYVATLFYALSNALIETSGVSSRIIAHRIRQILENAISKEQTNDQPKQLIFIPEEEISEIIKDYSKVLEENVNLYINREFGTDINKLKRNGNTQIAIEIRTNIGIVKLVSKKKKLEISSFSHKIQKLSIQFNYDDIEERNTNRHLGRSSYFKTDYSNPDTLTLKVPLPYPRRILLNEKKGSPIRDYELVIYELMILISQELFRSSNGIRRRVNDNSLYYLPAARSGILQGHRVLLSNFVKLLPTNFGVSDFTVERFSGVVADFLSKIVELGEEKKYLYDLAVEYENKIINGNVILSQEENRMNYSIEYKFRKMKIPLNRSSSTVSETAPVFLFLKHVLNLNDTVIIEEPEAHLHPSNQLLMADLITQMIRKGIKILLTTHSEILLEEINNKILTTINNGLEQSKMDDTRTSFLQKNEISVYNFNVNSRNNKTVVKELKIDNEVGIPQDEFLKVHEELYEQFVRLADLDNDETINKR